MCKEQKSAQRTCRHTRVLEGVVVVAGGDVVSDGGHDGVGAGLVHQLELGLRGEDLPGRVCVCVCVFFVLCEFFVGVFLLALS